MTKADCAQSPVGLRLTTWLLSLRKPRIHNHHTHALNPACTHRVAKVSEAKSVHVYIGWSSRGVCAQPLMRAATLFARGQGQLSDRNRDPSIPRCHGGCNLRLRSPSPRHRLCGRHGLVVWLHLELPSAKKMLAASMGSRCPHSSHIALHQDQTVQTSCWLSP